MHDALRSKALKDRRELAEWLQDPPEEIPDDYDPLLTAIHGAAVERDAADGAVRRLVTYAREYVPGKRDRYSLRALAQSAGRSETWAANASNDEERNAVARIIAVSRPVAAGAMDLEVAAMNRLTALADGDRSAVMSLAALRKAFPSLDSAAARRVLDWAHGRFGNTGDA